jgi:hypothetical protein
LQQVSSRRMARGRSMSDLGSHMLAPQSKLVEMTPPRLELIAIAALEHWLRRV